MDSEKYPEDHTAFSNSDEESSPGKRQLSLDVLLELLADRRRRYLLEYLREQPDTVASFDATIDHVLTKLAEKHGERPNYDELQVTLQHHHLPKLVDAGLIEYDVRRRKIRYDGNERLETLYGLIMAAEIG